MLFVGIFALLLMLIKVEIHKRIDKLNKRPEKSLVVYRINPLLILPYLDTVNTESLKLKKVCNLLWVLAVGTTIVVVICKS
jgi:hypothetical protein